MNEKTIKAMAKLGLELTKQERAFYLLFIATDAEVREFLHRENAGISVSEC